MELHRQTGSGEAGARVLIVEDHPMIAELVETRLRIEGMRPTKCLGGREAIQVLAHADFDLVILDIMMPEVDGYEATTRIRAAERTGRLPIVALTASATLEDRERCLAAGMDDFVSKPVKVAELARALARATRTADPVDEPLAS